MENRVLLRTSTTRDAIVAVAVLERSGIRALACNSAQDLVDEMGRGVGAVLVSEELLNGASQATLSEWLQDQPAWSDLPILVSARPGVDAGVLGRAFELFSNVTILERPMRIASLVSAVRSALRARERQFQLRTHLATLHEMDRRKNEFLATLAHELRNPMAPLVTTLAILRQIAPLPVGMKPYYDTMGRQVEHMSKLVDDLMEVSRITRGKIELKRQRLSIASLISDAAEVSRPGIESRQHTLVVDPIDPALRVDGDPVRLTQVFSNLLNNAARYTPDPGHIHVQVRRSQPSLTVSIRDTGLGIAPDDLRVIFDMFVQVPGTARVAQGGLGIGLTLVKSLVELHGGQVSAASEGLGRGSEFSVTLPLAEDVPAAEPAVGVEQAPADDEFELLADMDILVVDDNSDAADSLGELLRMYGAKVRVAYSGTAALGQFRAARPKVAILDIGMPGMDGYELARRLSQEAGSSDLYLVALTGWGQTEDRLRIAEAGFRLHLVKPVDFAELVEGLSAALRRQPQADLGSEEHRALSQASTRKLG